MGVNRGRWMASCLPPTSNPVPLESLIMPVEEYAIELGCRRKENKELDRVTLHDAREGVCSSLTQLATVNAGVCKISKQAESPHGRGCTVQAKGF